jgi:uncharacterized cupredoxin-like copper-binding protein
MHHSFQSIFKEMNMATKAMGGSALLIAATLAACRSDRPQGNAAASQSGAQPAIPAAATAPNLVHVIATDYKLELPAKIPAGAVTMHLMNQGKQMHQAMIARFEDGKTIADLAGAMKGEGPPPPWLKFVGGPNGIVPGATATTTSVLTPGQYAVFCVIPGADGTPHIAKGMIQPFEVTPSTGGAAMLPAADDTVHLLDYAFQTAHPVTAGSHAFLVQNDGPQGHEIVLLKLAPGKTAKDFVAWATTGGMKGPPPAMPMGGVGTIDKGESAVFTADLAPGDYAFICFLPDAKDGKLHAQHGMATQFKVS